MDDITACIKDYQYNDAIRKTVVDPEEALAKAIVDPIRKPNLTGKNPDTGVTPVDQLLAKLSVEGMLKEAVGRYFLCLSAVKVNPAVKQEQLATLQVLYNHLSEYASEDGHMPSRSEAQVIKSKLKSLTNFQVNIAAETESCSKLLDSADFINGDASQNQKIFLAATEKLLAEFWKPAFESFKKDEKLTTEYRDAAWFVKIPVTMDDFVIFRELGRGAFGVVSGARHRMTGQMVALKAMNRKLIKGKNVLKMVKAEFDILKTLGEKPSQYCVSLLYSFMDETDIYLGLPLCTGGDLMFHLRTSRKGYGNARTLFYATEIAMAIEHLHNLGILYRDLKPENVLLDEKGHTKISDMGLAVLTNTTPRTLGDKTFSGRAGTPGYWPPEMIRKEGYGFDADWWSYGVMLVEFFIGQCPFTEYYVKRPDVKDRNDATLLGEIQFPDVAGDDDEKIPEEAKDLILQLLSKDRSTRMGAQPDAIDRIKAHPYFASVDWGVKQQPPWLPSSNSINAVSQSELQERNKEHEFKKLKLEDSDNIANLEFSSRYHEQDVVHVLELQKKGMLDHLVSQSSGSGACTIL